MAGLPHGCHGNHPRRQASTLPQQVSEAGFSEQESEPRGNGKPGAASPSSQKRQDESVADVLNRIRIHPEATRVLGNSCIPVVSLERLNFQSVSSLCLQPVVSLVRLPRHAQAGLHHDVASLDQQQIGLSENETDVLEIRESSPESSGLNLSEPKSTCWTEPYCPDTSSSEEPEQDSGFDCESNPDQPFILFDSGTDEWDPDGKPDPDTFYLDPDPEPMLVIQLDPEPEADQDPSLELEVEPESESDADIVEIYDSGDQTPDPDCSWEESSSPTRQPEPGPRTEEMESEDFCAVCLNGGDLLCCDRCPKVFHVDCHIPALLSFPLGDWVCSLCRSDLDPAEAYDCENTRPCTGLKSPYTLSDQNQRRCEKLALLLYCHPLSAPFHEPVSPLARNYYQIIRRPIDLSVIRRKLDQTNTLHYFSPEQFVDDVLLMLKNCATFNYPDSEVAQAGRSLEVFFLSKLKEVFPERTFPSASQDRTDRARLRWLSRRRKENGRRRRLVFSGRRYFL